ncbi:MAG: hypothetical protein P8J27_15465 [Mariniblastus sp.]|nr:hypothetical protein [Mariniblastus sp.]
MAFFKTKPNVPNNEKARIEFHLQQILECIGFERFTRPVLAHHLIVGVFQTPAEIVNFAGQHLSHDVSGISVEVLPKELEKCGGGG